ncbi:MAG TPA: helix-turn-helix transcriptional regulator [Streptosporangiaceae bacterium]|nr:helix-turn-helix transcriptional regulator [Streptosporangiaceae bacterium]
MSMTSSQARRLGLLVAKARGRKAVSLRDLAWQVGVHTSWLGRLEQGDFADPAPDRLARVAEALDIEPERIDRITKGAVADGLPGMRTYFRAKYALSPEQVAQIERYVNRLRRAP